MFSLFLKLYWKPLLALALLVAVGAAVFGYGKTQYEAGYAQAQTEQKEADELLKLQREQEKTQIEYEALSRIEAARADAAFADATSERLRTELNRVRKLAERHTGTVAPGKTTSQIVGVLADMLEESNTAYRRTAEEAERYRAAGTVCEQQYDAIKAWNIRKYSHLSH